MKKTASVSLVILLITISLLSSCHGGSGTTTGLSGDTVAMATVKLADTTSFRKSNGEMCQIFAEATFDYPTAYADRESLTNLQRLYAQALFGAPDSMSLADAMQACVTNTLRQYDFSPGQSIDTLETENDGMESVKRYNTSISVKVHCNARDILNVCRVDVVKKNDRVTSVAHRYYTFDLQNMKRIGIADLFAEGVTPEVTNLLRTKLMEQNKVSSNDQLNDLGYFNIDNLTATDNFCFDEHGLTWSYLPGRLAVNAIGEPCITIPYENLSKYASQASVLRRFQP